MPHQILPLLRLHAGRNDWFDVRLRYIGPPRSMQITPSAVDRLKPLSGN
jgi:hypothetical protein